MGFGLHVNFCVGEFGYGHWKWRLCFIAVLFVLGLVLTMMGRTTGIDIVRLYLLVA